MSTPYIVAQPMLARRQLRLALVAAIQNIPGVNVYSPGDWNTPQEKMPAILVRITRERKESIAKTMPEFTTTVSAEIEARLEATTAEAAQDQIEALGYSIEAAAFKAYAVVGMCQQIASVDSESQVTSEGKQHIASLTMNVAFEMFEAFDPTMADPPLTAWPPAVPETVALESVGIHADLTNVFDPDGTYTPSPDAPPYTPTPAPRTVGPDGRDEGALDIELPQ